MEKIRPSDDDIDKLHQQFSRPCAAAAATVCTDRGLGSGQIEPALCTTDRLT